MQLRAFLLAFILLLGLAACGGGDDDEAGGEPTVTETDGTTTDDDGATTDDDGTTTDDDGTTTDDDGTTTDDDDVTTTDDDDGEGDAEAGADVYAQAGCGGCHALAAANSSGSIGPNLDEAEPSFDLVVERVTDGQGVMPAFKDQLTEQQIRDVAEFVSESAGDDEED